MISNQTEKNEADKFFFINLNLVVFFTVWRRKSGFLPGSDSFKTLNVKFVVRARLRIVDMSHLLKTYEGIKCDIFRLSVQNVCKRCLNLEKIYFQ